MAYTNEIKLDGFTTALGDLARANRFIVTFTGDGSGKIPDDLKYFCKNGQLPGRTLGDLPALQWMGNQDKRAGDPTYEDLTLNFHNDINFKIKKWIEIWMETIAGGITNKREVKVKYSAGIKMEQLGQGDNIIATYYLFGCYPKAMTAVDLGTESADTTTELSVTFNVDYWGDDSTAKKTVGTFTT